MEKSICRHLYIGGRVQGVGFRAFLSRHTQQLEITGWVKNLPDGRVEALFCGRKDKVEKIIDLSRQGPAWARVNRVEIIEENYQEYPDFKVKY